MKKYDFIFNLSSKFKYVSLHSSSNSHCFNIFTYNVQLYRMFLNQNNIFIMFFRNFYSLITIHTKYVETCIVIE